MTNTDDLIAALSGDFADKGPAQRGTGAMRFGTALLAAFALCAVVIMLWLDNPFAAYAAVGFAPLYFKLAFSLSLLLFAPLALWLLGRPGRDAQWMLGALAVPFVGLTMLFVGDLAGDPQPLFRGTWRTCLIAMLTLSPLAFGGAVLAVRQLAPTNLPLAGLVAGVFGGGVAMTAYTPFCPERGLDYMMAFYCLPILTMAAIGYLAGPRLLRW